MNNKAEAPRSLSAPAFEVTEVPAQTSPSRAITAKVTSVGRGVPLLRECFPGGFLGIPGQVLNPSCSVVRKGHRMAHGALEGLSMGELCPM